MNYINHVLPYNSDRQVRFYDFDLSVNDINPLNDTFETNSKKYDFLTSIKIIEHHPAYNVVFLKCYIFSLQLFYQNIFLSTISTSKTHKPAFLPDRLDYELEFMSPRSYSTLGEKHFEM